MSKSALGLAPPVLARNDARRVTGRVNANVRRQFSYLRGYLAIMGVLTLIAVASMSIALWRLFHFAH